MNPEVSVVCAPGIPLRSWAASEIIVVTAVGPEAIFFTERRNRHRRTGSC
jgi:hypothetical protein